MGDQDVAPARPPGRLLRLVTVTHYFESHRGGVELVAGRLVREFAAAGVETIWLAGDASPPPLDAPGATASPFRVWNIAERRLGIPFPLPAPSALKRIFRAVRDSEAVLLHDSLYLGNVAAFLAARWFGRPVEVVQHIGEVPYRNPLLRTLMTLANRLVARPILARADQVVFISEVTARYFGSVRFRRPPLLVFNGVDTDLFRPADAEARAQIRRRLGLPEEGVIALFCGRFVEKKGLPFLEAAARARPDVLWVLAGWGPVDPKSWGLPNVRVFEGMAHPALAELYRAADVFVLPSAGEGFPLVVQEALACGLPVVCGEETVHADRAAAVWLTGVPIEAAAPAAVGQLVAEAVDALMEGPQDGPERARFAAGRYAWRAAAARHLSLIEAVLPPR